MAAAVMVISAASATAVIAFDSWLRRGMVAAAPKTPPEAPVARSKAEARATFLTRSALLALQHANVTGNYAVLWTLASPEFQSANSSERLSEIFAESRRRRLDLSVTALADPVWTAPIDTKPDGGLRLSGYFPVIGGKLQFDLGYAPLEGQWRVNGLAVAFAPDQVAEARR